MMLALRLIVGALLASAAICFVAAAVTGQEKYRRRGRSIFKWTIVALVVFFAVLTLEALRP